MHLFVQLFVLPSEEFYADSITWLSKIQMKYKKFGTMKVFAESSVMAYKSLGEGWSKTFKQFEFFELHVWSITSDKISLTAHVVLDAKMNSHEVLTAVRQVLFERYHISHTTLQQEDKTCLDSKFDCHFHR